MIEYMEELQQLLALMPYAVEFGRPLHRGRSLVVIQTDLVDAQNRSVGQVAQTQAVTTEKGS